MSSPLDVRETSPPGPARYAADRKCTSFVPSWPTVYVMSERLDRRGFLTVVPVAAAAAVLAPGVTAAAAGTANMELVVLAAQCDPVKPDTGLTPGAAASVRLVEQALVDEGLLA